MVTSKITAHQLKNVKSKEFVEDSDSTSSDEKKPGTTSNGASVAAKEAKKRAKKVRVLNICCFKGRVVMTWFCIRENHK